MDLLPGKVISTSNADVIFGTENAVLADVEAEVVVELDITGQLNENGLIRTGACAKCS
jgi:hypothetical protein